jgi:hypothetical protein
VRSFAALTVATLLAGLGSTAASACILPPFSRIEKASDVIVEGRYFQDPTDRASGHIEARLVERGEHRERYEIRWSIEFLESREGECATQVPADRSYERFYLLSRDDGHFHMIGRIGVEDPDGSEGTHE